MAYRVGATVKLDGEREFKQALTEINAGIKVNASELRLLSAQYSQNGNSVKALTDRGIALQNQINSQREKVETLRAALQNAATQYGESDKKTANWKVSLNNAEIQLMSMEGELKDNSEALQKATQDMEKYGLKEDEVHEQTKTLGGSLSDMISQLGINLPAGADKAIKALDGSKVSMAALIGATTGIITGFAKTTIETAKTANEIKNLAQTTGMTTAAYQEWDYILRQNGYTMEQAQGDLSQLAEKAMDAAEGAGEGAELFQKLHIRVKDMNGQLKTQEELFGEVITKLQGMSDETERNAIASALMSTTGERLVPILNMTADELEDIKQKSHDMGYVMDDEALSSMQELYKSMEEFNAQSEAFKRSISMVILPPLTVLFETLNKIDPKILATVAIIGSIAIVAVTVVKGIKSITDIFGGLNPVALKTTGIVVGVVAGLIALAAIIGVIIGKGDEMTEAMENIGNSTNSMVNTVNQAPNRYRVPRYAIGTNYHPGGLAWTGENGPELMDLPAGTRVYTNRQSMQMMQQMQGGDTFNLYVRADEIGEVQKMVDTFKNLKRQARAGKVTG
jgi:hypothetical protein